MFQKALILILDIINMVERRKK